MLVLLHGDGGATDEIAIAVVALGVLWLAIRLAGRGAAPSGKGDAGVDPTGGQTAATGRDDANPPVTLP